jgi:hypothetical protein
MLSGVDLSRAASMIVPQFPDASSRQKLQDIVLSAKSIVDVPEPYRSPMILALEQLRENGRVAA